MPSTEHKPPRWILGLVVVPVLFAGGFLAAVVTKEDSQARAAAELRTEAPPRAVSVSTVSRIGKLPQLPAPRKPASSKPDPPGASVPAAPSPPASAPVQRAPSRAPAPAPPKKSSGDGGNTVTIISQP